MAPEPPSSTTEVRTGHAFDVAALERFMAVHVAPFVAGGAGNRLVTVRQFEGGQSNPTFYLCDARHTEYVLRKQPPGALLPSAHAVDREYRIMAALAGSGVPVPEVLALCSDTAVLGSLFYLMRFLRHAVIYRDVLLPGLPPDRRARIYDSMNRALAAIHSVDVNKLGLESFGSSGDYYARQLSRWSRQYRTSQVEGEAASGAMQQLGAWLQANLPREQGSALVHGDFRLDNLMFDPASDDVVAVLDWELSTIGNPLADLAYNCLAYHLPPELNAAFQGFGGLDLAALGIPSERLYLDAYCRRTGRSAVPANWHFYLAFSMFRGAAILQGVYKRAKQGNASSARAEIVGALATRLADAAWGLVQRHEQQRPRPFFAPPQGSAAAASPTLFDCSNDAFQYAAGSLGISERAKQLRQTALEFIRTKVLPAEPLFLEQINAARPSWVHPPILDELKTQAKALGLWNMFLPKAAAEGQQLSNVEYATIAELSGMSILAPEVFNCSAPDTGNMEILHLFGSAEQKEQWLAPLLAGEIRSCFAMTEPEVASSDATNVHTSIESQGNNYLINGRKWYISGAGDPRCKIAIVMGRTNPDAPKHQQQSMVLVPMDTPGVTVLGACNVFGYDDAPHGHMEIDFHNVLVPKSNILLGEGRGFEISQARLGPGRIHHCMRAIGMAERAFDAMCHRALARKAFGKKLAQFDTVMDDIAASREEIEQARLLTLMAAQLIDTVGVRGARSQIAMIKVAVPNMACRVVDRAIQVHGAAGVSQSSFLAYSYASLRTLRIADGPDQVHRRTVAQLQLRRVLAKL